MKTNLKTGLQTQIQTIEVEAEQIVCRQGDPSADLLMVLEGELLVCIRQGTQVTPIAKMGPGAYVGELSFFDHRKRGADILSLTKTKLLRISSEDLRSRLPDWMHQMGKCLAEKLRALDETIKSKGLKKQNVHSLRPLSIEEQRHIYHILVNPDNFSILATPP